MSVWECAVCPVSVCLLWGPNTITNVWWCPPSATQDTLSTPQTPFGEKWNNFSSSATLLMSCHCQVVRKSRVRAFIYLFFIFPKSSWLVYPHLLVILQWFHGLRSLWFCLVWGFNLGFWLEIYVFAWLEFCLRPGKGFWGFVDFFF